MELYSAKIFDFSMSSPVSRVVEAIYWAIEKNVNIINLSFGTTQNNEALHQAVQEAYNAGILIVAAAGNNGTVEYPAAYPEVIAVGSVNSQGEAAEATAEGAALEVTAPGERIAATSHFGGIGVASGTSLAAPHVVGVASVLWQKDLSKSNEFIRTVLKASANGNDETAYGYGTVDLAYALEVYEQLKDTEIAASTPVDVETVMEENEVSENTDAIETAENDYVEGSWSRTDHESFVGEIGNENAFDKDSSTHIMLFTCFKRGTRANDTYIGGMTVYPEFHGWAYQDEGDTTVKNNYVFSYILLIDIAQYLYTAYGVSNVPAFSLSDSATASAILGNNSNLTATSKNRIQRVYDSMTSRVSVDGLLGVNGIQYSWSQVFSGTPTPPNADSSGNVGYSPTAARICAFVYGMAAHIIADTFAHSAYAKQDNQNIYTHIIHETDHTGLTGDPQNLYKKDADDPFYFQNRSDCAKKAVNNTVYHYYSGGINKTDGSITDYILTDTYNGSFQLRYIYDYVLQATNGTATNNTLTSAQKTYFSGMNNVPS